MLKGAIKRAVFSLLYMLMTGVAKWGKTRVREAKAVRRKPGKERTPGAGDRKHAEEPAAGGPSEYRRGMTSGIASMETEKVFPHEFFPPRTGVWEIWNQMAWSCPDRLRREAS